MIIIRKGTLEDAHAIATCLLLAMEDIVYKFIGEKDSLKAKEFMWHMVEAENNQYSYQNAWVAENDTGVVAALNLYDGAKLAELRQPVVEHLSNKFNRQIQPEDETGAGEYYVDSLGVMADHQGKGIGLKMIQFIIDEYVHKRQQTLGLLVDEENQNAKRLYLKLGFQPVGTKTLLGKTMEHLQITRYHREQVIK